MPCPKKTSESPDIMGVSRLYLSLQGVNVSTFPKGCTTTDTPYPHVTKRAVGVMRPRPETCRRLTNDKSAWWHYDKIKTTETVLLECGQIEPDFEARRHKVRLVRK